MQAFTRKDLEGLVKNLQPEHYSMDLDPLLAVVFLDSVAKMAGSDGVTDIKMLMTPASVYHANGFNTISSGLAALVHDGKLLTVHLGYLGAENNDAFGIGIDSRTPVNPRRFYQMIIEAAQAYQADNFWQEAVNRGLCNVTAKQHEADRIAYETKRNWHEIRLYAEETNGVWTFDGKAYLWGSCAGQDSTPPATLTLEISNRASMSSNRPIIKAVSSRAIFAHELHNAGFVDNSTGCGDIEAYYADESRKPAMLAAFDRLVAAVGMNVICDYRNTHQ